MTLQIGMIVGGDTTENAPTVARIRQMIAEAEAANAKEAFDFDLDVTFHVAGAVWSPPFTGVRPGRIATDRRYFPVKIGVPESFPTDLERDRFLSDAMRVSMRSAEEAVQRRRYDWSLSEIHEVVEQVVRRSLEASSESAERNADAAESSSGTTIETERDDSSDREITKLYSSLGWPKRYWEAWRAEGQVLIHTGVVGDRGQLSVLTLAPGQMPEDVIRAAAQRQSDEGYERLEEADQSILIVQLPRDHFRDAHHALQVWGEVEGVLNEELGWLGLGRCSNVDYSGDLTFTVLVVDEALGITAVRDVLNRWERLGRASIGVERSGKYVTAWPESRKGTTMSY